MKNKTLSIITYRYNYKIWRLDFYKNLKNFFKKYHGHYGVTRSLIEGLKINGKSFIYNKFDIKADVCWVLSDSKALNKKIKMNNYKYLIAGPNISILPTHDDCILLNDKVDLIVVPSEWVKKLYEKFTNKKILVWYAGIDASYWNPSKRVSQNKILIYFKHPNRNILKNVSELIKKLNISYKVLEYGSYSQSLYKKELLKSKLVIFITLTESQSLALAESWAMNVPTFVRKSEFDLENKFKKYSHTSNAPYLNKDNGMFFEDLEKLSYLIQKLFNNELEFSPRKWVINNMTDKISAYNAIRIIENLPHK